MGAKIGVVATIAAILATAGIGQVSTNKPVSGQVAGKGFQPTFVEVRELGANTVSVQGKVVDRARAYVLKFANSQDFTPNQFIEIWFATDLNAALPGTTIVCKPVKFGTEEYRTQHYQKTGQGSVARNVTSVSFYSSSQDSNGVPTTVNEEISCKLSFGKVSGGYLTGTVSLSLPGSPQTQLKGAFRARVSN